MEAESTFAATTESLQQSSKEGKGFKYNEDGRRYHGNEEVVYIMPNDEDEADRLHEQHWVLRYALQCNYHAPVTEMLEEGITVLDSGCGPATWTFEMGETFPKSKFYGIDVSSVFPEAIKPANVELSVANITKNIPFPDNTFDYIHQRLLFAGLTHEDWENTLKELHRVLKPGGYIELAEFSIHDVVNLGPLNTKYFTVFMDMFESKGIPPRICAELKDRLVKAGFVNENVEIVPLPMNHDGKRGELLWKDLKHAGFSMRPAFMKACPEWEDAAIYKDYIEAIGEENKEHKTCINWFVCYAQKPLEE